MDEQPTSFWEPCWACRVISGEPVGHVIAATEEVVVLLNPFPINPGHALVVPRRHVRDIYGLPDELTGPILSMAARIARAVKREFTADGVTLRQNNEAASDQHLFHFHLHVIPRVNGDLFGFQGSPELAVDDVQQMIAVRLRGALDSTGNVSPTV